MRSKSIFLSMLWIIALPMVWTPDLKGQNKLSSVEVLIEYPDTSWKSSVLIIENGSFRHDLKDIQADENGRAYVQVMLEKPAFARLEMFGKSYSVNLFLWPGDVLHLIFTNSPETETISYVDFQGQTRNIQKFFYEYQNFGVSRRYPDLLDSLNIGNSVQDSLSINAWMIEHFSATEPEVYFLDMFKAKMFGQKWLFTQRRATSPIYSKDTTSFTFPDEVLKKTKALYDQYPQLNSISQLATKMGFGKYEIIETTEMINCTQLRMDGDFTQTPRVRARLESSSRMVNPRKMTAKDVDFIRDCLFLLKGTENYEEDLENALKSMYAGLPESSSTIDLGNIEPNAKVLDNPTGKDSLIILMLYDYHTEDSIFQKPEWLQAYPLNWVAVSLDYTTAKWEEGKSKIPTHIPSIHLKGGITHSTAKTYQWYQYPRLVLYNSKTHRVLEHIMPEYERKDLWEEILSGKGLR
ncbi:MAG: hypothetical protein IPI60_19515 [Saprospiraceae bacterium]|nr:hypothetical protein [Saprospiraceae bacterium]